MDFTHVEQNIDKGVLIMKNLCRSILLTAIGAYSSATLAVGTSHDDISGQDCKLLQDKYSHLKDQVDELPKDIMLIYQVSPHLGRCLFPDFNQNIFSSDSDADLDKDESFRNFRQCVVAHIESDAITASEAREKCILL